MTTSRCETGCSYNLLLCGDEPSARSGDLWSRCRQEEDLALAKGPATMSQMTTP